MPPFARIAFALPRDQTFQYDAAPLIAEGLAVGDLVRAPFGRRRGDQVGCVVEIGDDLDASLRDAPEKIRPLAGRATPGHRLPEEIIALARWIAGHYACGWGEALASASLVGFNDVGRQTERWLSLADPENLPAKLTAKQRLVVDLLREAENIPRLAAEIETTCGVGASVLRRMIDAGVLLLHRRAPHRPDPYDQQPAADTPPTLSDDQATALEAITAALDAERTTTFLLHGVTASGKTEVYLRALERCFAQGRQAIILVPEIALTPQTVGRFRARFGDRVGVMHSRLSLGQRLALGRRVAAGEVDVVVGARSAIFTPLPRVGLIVVDEEHEGSYKQVSPAPRYHARDVAIVRAQRLGAVVVLGSATPSLESSANAARGKFQRLTLPRRIGTAALPAVRLIDMSEELADHGTPSLLSSSLREALATRLARGEQSIVLLNRRGFAAFMLCPACRETVRCDHCDVAMTWHRARNRLVCHWCEATRPTPRQCPQCEARDLVPMGLGTQRAEETLQTEFPAARLLRVDLDTTRGKDAFLAHWRRITAGEVDIILGTQMIAKGLDLPNVTLVGVISADQTLFLPDFRSAERAFQLMTQVAGRAGRAERPGEVLIQTFVPHHYALRFALDHDHDAFFREEMRRRRLVRFPPTTRLVSLLFTGKEERDVTAAAKRMGSICRTLTHLEEMRGDLTVIGPAPAPIARLSDRWRWRVLLRAPSSRVLHRALALARTEFAKHAPPRGAQMTIDVDPLDLM